MKHYGKNSSILFVYFRTHTIIDVDPCMFGMLYHSTAFQIGKDVGIRLKVIGDRLLFFQIT